MYIAPCELAWAAGFIDADGTITIRRGARNGNIQHQALVQLAQRDYPENRIAVEKLQKMFGGYLNTHTPNLPGRHQMVVWGVASKKAAECLALIVPYLLVKKKNAALVLQFHNGKTHFVGGPKKRLTEYERQWREQKWLSIRELNKKGVLTL